jgi:hypothetical protein
LKRPAGSKVPVYSLTDQVEALHIVQGERTDHDIEGVRRKMKILYCRPAIFNP